MIDLRKGLLALLLCMGLASSALAQGWPPVPLGPSGGGGGGGGGGGSGTVTSVSASDGLFSVAAPTTTPALSVAGTSGGIPYFNSASSWASSAALAANALVIGGGAGVAPSTVTTNSTVLTALGATPTGAGSIVLATSPTLVTPALGVAIGTSLALGGATLGSNALAVTGLVNLASAGASTAPTLSIGNSTTGLYSVSTTGLGLTVNGAASPVLDYGITNSGALTLPGLVHFTSSITVASNITMGGSLTSTTTTGVLSFNSGDTVFSRHAAANWQLGSADAAAPIAQTLGVQSVVAGTSNTAGANWTLNGSVSTGSGTSGDIVFKTGGTGAAATVQNSEVAALTLKGATQTVQLNATAYPSCGSLATNSSGVIGCGSGPVPLTVGGSASLTGSLGYYVCTTTCSITLPTPAAGTQFCVRNDSAVTTVITIVAISLVQFEKTTYNGYGTVTTGTMVSGGALGDKICLVGRDATHYLVGSFVGTWTNS